MDIENMETFIFPSISYPDQFSPYASLCDYVAYSVVTQGIHHLIHYVKMGMESEYFNQIDMFSLDDTLYNIASTAINDIGSMSAEPEDPMASLINEDKEKAGRTLFDHLFRVHFDVIAPLQRIILNSDNRYIDYHVSEAHDKLVVRLKRENTNEV